MANERYLLYYRSQRPLSQTSGQLLTDVSS